MELENASILLERRLVPVVAGPEIGVFLGVSSKLVSRASACPERYYHEFKILKKNGSFRTISAPRVYLKTIQRYLLDCILSRVKMADCVIGFVRGRRVRDGASRHVGAKFLWNIDLKDFFPSIKSIYVKNIYLNLGYSEQAAGFLTKLCCLHGVLPQGAPTSPMLANLSFAEADLEIMKLCQRQMVAYTRYADDLSFSCSNPIEPGFQGAILAVIGRHDFRVNAEKTRLVGPLCRREVTGLTINEKVSVPRPIRRNIRAMVHNYCRSPDSVKENLDQIRGRIAYIANHHPDEAQRLLRDLEGV